MRIFYLSSVNLIDADINILSHLSKIHEIIFRLLIPESVYIHWGKELNRLREENKLIQSRIVRLKYRRRNPFNIPLDIRLILEIRRGHYDIIYINDFEDVYFRLLFAVFIRKDKTVYGIHDVAYHSGWKHKIIKRASREVFLRKFDTVLTFSRSQAKLLESKCRRVFSVPLALKCFGDSSGIKKDYSTIQFLFFGNIASYKGLDILITVIKKLSLKYNNFRLIIAGDCNDWESVYKPMIADNKYIVADIRYIENDEIPDYFASSHYLILPYKDVTQSGPLMIAYYYQVPVIASDLEGFREYIQEGTTGFIFSAGQEDQLEKELENSILRKKETYEHLVCNMKDFVSQQYGPAAIASKYDHIFKEVYEH